MSKGRYFFKFLFNRTSKHCSCLSASGPLFTPTIKYEKLILKAEHESAAIAVCDVCSTYYLIYDVECRDDTFIYYSPIAAEVMKSLVSVSDQSKLRNLIKSNVLGKRVFVKSPWEAKWDHEIAFLPEPRPW